MMDYFIDLKFQLRNLSVNIMYEFISPQNK